MNQWPSQSPQIKCLAYSLRPILPISFLISVLSVPFLLSHDPDLRAGAISSHPDSQSWLLTAVPASSPLLLSSTHTELPDSLSWSTARGTDYFATSTAPQSLLNAIGLLSRALGPGSRHSVLARRAFPGTPDAFVSMCLFAVLPAPPAPRLPHHWSFSKKQGKCFWSFCCSRFWKIISSSSKWPWHFHLPATWHQALFRRSQLY